jgi:uncharacterized protein YciI
MKTFAVIYHMVDTARNAQARPQHLQFLESMRASGRVETGWRFPGYQDGQIQGIVICRAETRDEVEQLFLQDPAIASGARRFEVREAEQGLFAARPAV